MLLRTIVCLLSLCCLLLAQDEAKLLPPFQKAFRYGKREKPAPVAERAAALGTLAGLDSVKVAEAIVDGWRNVDAELADLDAEREQRNAEMAELIKGQEDARSRSLPQDKHARYNELRELLPQLRERADALRELQQQVGSRIGELRRKDTLMFLLQKVVPNKKDPLPLRLFAARALGGGATDIVDELAAALGRAREVEEQLALLDAMVLAGKVAQLHATPVVQLLQSKDEAVRERAALALAKIAVPEAIEPMIGVLAKASGQTRLRIASALEVLTGQQHGINVGAWQSWWAAEGAAFKAGQRPLGAGTPSHRKDTDKNYYFGIPQDQCNSILYVIDCSDSMKAPVDFQTPGTTAGGKAASMTRLEACKKELIRALGLLRPEQKFAILWYNDLPHWWQPKMQPATKDVVAQAQQFVAQLKHASTTNIHDSLEQGFKLVGRGAKDKYYGVELDTIFLLTDGAPTTVTGQLDSTEKILLSVRSWNPLKRVTIHTIGIGKDLNDAFLGQLARENGGEYKKF